MASKKKAATETTKYKNTVDLASGDRVEVLRHKRGSDGLDSTESLFQHSVRDEGTVTVNLSVEEVAEES